MRFGIVILPQARWADARGTWIAAEQLGFDSAWIYDHLSWRSLADEPWYATVPTLAAAAEVTSSIRLGTFVSSPNFRHPVPFAKDVATIDDISGGRFVLGIGSGGTGFDAFVLAQPQYTPRERHARFVEFVAHLDTLLRFEHEGGISFEGEWYTAKDARMVGTPAQSPRMPFVLAANGPQGLRLVAERAEGWVTTGPESVTGEAWWDAVATLSHKLDDAASAIERDPLSIERYLSIDSGGQYSLESAAAFEDIVGRAKQLGFSEVIAHWPRPAGIYAGNVRALEEVAALLPALR